jgi:dipeptidyl aminopeptidase/acylaminoacyl peptidase
MRALVATFLALAVLPFSFANASTPQPFTFDDFAKIVRLSDPQISPDGRRIAVVVSRPDMTGDMTKSEIDLVDVATGDSRPLTQGRDHAAMPRWSPDGTELAFVTAPACLSTPCKAAQAQVFIFSMSGGDPRQATTAPNGVANYAWRPDGRALAYVTSDDAANKAEIDKHRDLFVVGDQDFLSQAAPVPSHVWLQPFDGNASRITSGAESLGGGAFASDISWSADGTRIAFSRLPDTYNGHIGHTNACIVEVASKSVSCLAENGAYGQDAEFAPTGDAVAYVDAHDGYWSIQVDALVRDGSQTLHVAPEIDRDISWQAWAHDGTGLWLGANDRTTVGLWYAPLHGTPRRIDLGDIVFGRQGSVAKDGALAFIGATPADPSELYYLAPGGGERRLTDRNAWLADRTIARSREFTWTNEGFNEDGALTYPANYVAGKTYPLVLVIHGGPTETASSIAFSAFVQVLAAHGYFVLQPNYRGSDNLGFAYGKALVGDVDAGPGRDIVAGTRALEATGMIDGTRIGVSGWSGGGLLTSWLIGHYTIWKAAVSGAAVNDFIEEYDLSDVFDYMPSLMGGLSPWRGDGHARYVAASPITYAAHVTAPTLILSDTGDYRVPTVQAYAFYHALKESGKTVQFVAIPAYGHFPSDPVRQIEVYKRWTAWMDQYLH